MFKEQFIKLCNEKGVAPTVVCQSIGLSNAAFSKWGDESIPRRATLQKLADYFGVSVDYLLGNAEKEKPSEEGSGGEDVVVVNRSGKRFVHHLSPEQLDILSGMIEQMEKNNQ